MASSTLTISFDCMKLYFVVLLYMSFLTRHFSFEKYCTPSQLYLILAAFSLITAFLIDFRISTLIVNGIFVALYGWFLNFLCSKKLGFISWALVLAPFVLFAAMFFLALDAVDLYHEEGEKLEPFF